MIASIVRFSVDNEAVETILRDENTASANGATFLPDTRIYRTVISRAACNEEQCLDSFRITRSYEIISATHKVEDRSLRK